MSASSASFQRRLVYIVFLVGIGLLHVATAQQDPICNCPGGCGRQGIFSPDGRKVNVAYGKSASISSMYGEGDWKAGPACMAVNGKTGTTYAPLSGRYGPPNCVHSGLEDYQASWQVDLGDNYFVESITIYRRETQMGRMAMLTVEVDRVTCYDFPDSITGKLPERMDIICQQPLTGRYVTIRKRQTITGYDQYINICEVQVWMVLLACIDDTYGENCASTCGSAVVMVCATKGTEYMS